MKIAMISDVHEQWQNIKVPACDLLISAGDYSYLGKKNVVMNFHQWLKMQPAKHIISVQGNHEVWVEKNFHEAKEIVAEIEPRIKFIAEGALEIEGVKIYCSSVQPEFGGWAWNVPRGEKIKRHWDAIPDDTEILVTHGPPYGILDQIVPRATPPNGFRFGEDDYHHLGCKDLRTRLGYLDNLKLHVFGHIHGSSGETKLGGIKFVNASICNENYKPINPVREFVFKR